MRADDAKRRQLPDGWDDGLHYYAVPVDDERPETKPRTRGASGD